MRSPNPRIRQGPAGSTGAAGPRTRRAHGPIFSAPGQTVPFASAPKARISQHHPGATAETDVARLAYPSGGKPSNAGTPIHDEMKRLNLRGEDPHAKGIQPMVRKWLFLALLSLVTLSATVPRGPVRAEFLGKFRGVVAAVDDPLSLGRIRATVPAVLGAETTAWAMPALPFAGAGHGLVLLPEVGDNIWIEFENGDPASPIWTGTWFTSAQMPVTNPATTRALVTHGGHKIRIDDASNQIDVTHAGGGAIRLTDDEISLSVGATSFAIRADGIYLNGKLFRKTD